MGAENSRYFIQYNDQCLAPRKDGHLEFVDCDAGGTMRDKLWEPWGQTPRSLGNGYCLDVYDGCRMPGQTPTAKKDAVYMRPCAAPKAALSWQGDRLCCNIRRSCIANPAAPVLLGANESRALRLERVPEDTLRIKCCHGEYTGKRCGLYKPGTADCDRVMFDTCGLTDVESGGPVFAISGNCRQWCRGDPEHCDILKRSFCERNPTHEMCACIRAGDGCAPSCRLADFDKALIPSDIRCVPVTLEVTETTIEDPINHPVDPIDPINYPDTIEEPEEPAATTIEEPAVTGSAGPEEPAATTIEEPAVTGSAGPEEVSYPDTIEEPEEASYPDTIEEPAGPAELLIKESTSAAGGVFRVLLFVLVAIVAAIAIWISGVISTHVPDEWQTAVANLPSPPTHVPDEWQTAVANLPSPPTHVPMAE